MKKGLAWFFIFLGLPFFTPPNLRADATIYWDFDNGFSPSTVVIGPGETVTWWNVDPYGFSVTVTIGGSTSFSLDPYEGQPVGFPDQPGTYGFQSNWGNNGAVVVNLPPSVTITNPLAGAVFAAPATFAIQATAADTADDVIADVQFFLADGAGTNFLADVYNPPFTTGVTNLTAGSYALLAVATDSHGATATNAISITVQSTVTAITLATPRWLNGSFLFDATGLTPGKTNVLQTSSDLISWQPAATNVAVATSLTLTNTPASATCFYRLGQLP
jgi:hypothetical protein